MKKILIFGKNGQVGSALNQLLALEKQFKVESYCRKDVDFSDLKSLELFLKNLKNKPDFIINACGYTNVDKAETERELADLVNHKAVAVLADYSAKTNVILIHYSTDYVFDGSGSEAFNEDNKENLKPVNYYGKTKLDGENAVINSGCNYIILRTSWVWSEDKNFKNFVNTIEKLALEKEEINVVNDQVGAPTKASDIALVTIKIIQKLINLKKDPKEIYHFAGNQNISWYDFACEIVKNLKKQNIKLKLKKINPIRTIDYKTTAKRPLNSRLNYKKINNFLAK